jgi:lysophospholipase L1-like esterase
MAIPRLLYGKLGLAIASPVLVLLIAETAVRIHDRWAPPASGELTQRSPHPDYSYELVSNQGTTISRRRGWLKLVLHPYLGYKNAPNQHNGLFNVNSLGFRGREIHRQKAREAYRVILLGGSAVFGTWASSDEGTLPSLLEQQLNRAIRGTKRFEVINAGVIGYVSAQEFVYLATELLDLGPDLVIVYDGYNDFLTHLYLTDACRHSVGRRAFRASYMFFHEIEAQLIASAQARDTGVASRLKALLGSLVGKTALGRLWLGQPGTSQVAAPPSTGSGSPQSVADEFGPTCANPILETYAQSLSRIARLASLRPGRLLMAVQPVIEWKKPLSEAEGSIVPWYPWLQRATQRIYPQLLAVAERVAKEEGVPFLDLRPAFENQPETLFADPVHLTDWGNAVVAQVLSDYLLAQGLRSGRGFHGVPR